MNTCGCGKAYEPTASGRWTHRVLMGHTPTGETKEDAS